MQGAQGNTHDPVSERFTAHGDNGPGPIQVPDDPGFAKLLDSAARLQQLVPDAVLVGGTAAVLRAGHRISFDHDHVVTDLSDRYDLLLDALEREKDWVTNRTRYGKIILGELGDIEAGVRQLIRARPLETEQVTLSTGAALTVPTAAETLRIKAFLVVKRNQTRDYLDVAALADRYGLEYAAAILCGIDDYYAEQAEKTGAVSAQVALQLSAPRPRDFSTTQRLAEYKGLIERWTNWGQVQTVCTSVAARMVAYGVDRQ